MDVKSLYTLVAVADCGSFAEAGERLGLSASSVSLQIRALEEETGLPLFDRATRPPSLSEEGQDFVLRSRDLLRRWETLTGGPARDLAQGVLRIGAVHTAVAGATPVALRRLQDAHPALHIRLVSGLTHELEAQLRRRAIDCAIVTVTDAADSDLRSYHVADEPLVVVAAHGLAHGTDREILEALPYVRFNRRARVGQSIEAELTKMKIKVRSRMEIDTLDAVISVVRNGLGVSVVPFDAGGRAFPSEILSVPFGVPPVMRRLGIVTRRDNSKTHFIDLLVRELRQLHHGHTNLERLSRDPGLLRRKTTP